MDAPNKRGRLYRRHEAWQNVIAWLLRQVGIGITGSAFGTTHVQGHFQNGGGTSDGMAYDECIGSGNIP